MKKTMKAVWIPALLLAMAIGFLAVAGPQTHAQPADSPELFQRLDQIAADQKAILAELAEMKEQMRILTIRVTQSQ